MAKMGDLWTQSTLEITAVAKNLHSYGSGEAKDPVDILIQNNHASGIVYVNLSGTATVSTTMLMVRPGGGILELKNIRNTVSVIGSVASNTIPYAIVKNGG